MKIVRSTEITDVNLVSSNVVEVPPAAYSGATSYDTDDQASILTGTLATVYESLVDGNVGNDPASSPTFWRAIGTAYLEYNAGTSYSIDDIVTDSTSHQLFKSLANANLGNPLTDASKWIAIGPTNRWNAFDSATNSQSIRPDSIIYEFEIADWIDTIGLLNVSAASANVVITDPIEGVIKNEDYSLVNNDAVVDYFEYCFEKIIRKSDLAITGLPNVYNPTITVTLTGEGDLAIGRLDMGQSYTIGTSQFGAQVSGDDYSKFIESEIDGSITIVQRAFYKRARFDVDVPRLKVDFVYDLLLQYRATPVMVIGSEYYTSMFFYGLIRRRDIVHAEYSYSTLNVEVRGF